MPDLDKLADDLARRTAALGRDFIPMSRMRMDPRAPTLIDGFPMLAPWDGARVFLSRYPAWTSAPHGKGVELNPRASAHAKMAWAAFVREVQAAEGRGDHG